MRELEFLHTQIRVYGQTDCRTHWGTLICDFGLHDRAEHRIHLWKASHESEPNEVCSYAGQWESILLLLVWCCWCRAVPVGQTRHPCSRRLLGSWTCWEMPVRTWSGTDLKVALLLQNEKVWAVNCWVDLPALDRPVASWYSISAWWYVKHLEGSGWPFMCRIIRRLHQHLYSPQRRTEKCSLRVLKFERNKILQELNKAI